MKASDGVVSHRLLRLFAGSWSLIMLLVAGLAGELPPVSVAGVLLCGAALFFATGLLRPEWMRRPYRLVDRLLAPVGRLFALLMLAVVYFGVFALFALALRLLKWDPLRLRRVRWPASGWVVRSAANRSSGYHWQY